MVGEEYDEELEDIEQDLREEEVEKQQEAYDTVAEDTSPTYQSKDDLYSLFWKVVKTGDSSKVGNLDKTELGLLNISVRDCQRIGLIGKTLDHPGFAEFFFTHGEITLATSGSKKGWLPELFVSQKKFTSKDRVSNLPSLQQPVKKKRLFGGRKSEPVG